MRGRLRWRHKARRVHRHRQKWLCLVLQMRKNAIVASWVGTVSAFEELDRGIMGLGDRYEGSRGFVDCCRRRGRRQASSTS